MKTKSTLKEKNANDFLTHTREFGAITLISLVITIVILIILASVAIYLSLGNNGIFTRAKEAKETTNKQTATEIINLKITTAQMNKYAEKQEMPTLKELSEVLRDDSEIEYVTETSKVAVAEYDVSSENPTSIFTKLNKYPYEFEINSSLQLASINGVKIATRDDSTNILYERSNEDNAITNNLILNDNIDNYKRVKIDYRNEGKRDTKEIHIINSSVNTDLVNTFKSTYNGKSYFAICRCDLTIVENKLSISNHMKGLIYEGTQSTWGENGGVSVYIDRIIGYKTY